jgi:pimeloyl-ACP methyl ester carboxylesterase
MIFENEELKEHEWNPLYYNMGNAIYSLVARDFAPLNERLGSVKSRLEGVPAVVGAAKANLKNPPKVFTETAILQNKGNVALIREELSQFVAEAGMEQELAAARESAARALEAYGEWLEQDLLPRSTGDFRIGDAMWRKKLRFSLDADLSKEQIYQRATADLEATQKAMYQTALPLFKQYFPDEKDEKKLKDMKFVCKSVLDKLAEERPGNDTIVDEARKTPAILAGYEAPFPDASYKAGAQMFPLLVPIAPDDPGAAENRAAWTTLERWQKPCLLLWGPNDPVLGVAAAHVMAQRIPSAQEPEIIDGAGHFLQEDRGEQIAERIVRWLAAP